MSHEEIGKRKRNEPNRKIAVKITAMDPFDILGFRRACAAAEIRDNFPLEPNAGETIYAFQPEDDPNARPEMIVARNIGETLAHGAGALRKEMEVRASR